MENKQKKCEEGQFWDKKKKNREGKSKEKAVDEVGAALNVWVRSLKLNAEASRIFMSGFEDEKE